MQFLADEPLSRAISDDLKQITDIERLISKIATEHINLREVMVLLYRSLEAVVRIATQLFTSSGGGIQSVWRPCPVL